MIDTFETIAEIAIALTGFTGIVTVLGHGGRGEWGQIDLFRVKALLYWSLGTMFLAFVPTFISGLGVEASLWRVSHATFAVFHGAVFVWYSQAIRRTGAQPSRFSYAMLSIGTLMLLVEVLVALGYFADQAQSLYLLALLWFLFLAALSFAMLLFDSDE